MTDTITMQRELLTLDAYLQLTGKSERTVRRWLADGRLAGAQQVEGGLWLIPSDAVPGAPGSGPTPSTGRSGQPGSAVAPAAPRAARAAAAPAAPTLSSLLDQQPGYLDIDTAARLLGVEPRDIRANRAAFEVPEWCGPRSIRVPQAVVRRIAGISA